MNTRVGKVREHLYEELRCDLAVIVNYFLMSGTIISAISADGLYDLAFMSPLYNLVAGIFMITVTELLFALFFCGMAIYSSTSVFSINESVKTTEEIVTSSSGMTVW